MNKEREKRAEEILKEEDYQNQENLQKELEQKRQELRLLEEKVDLLNESWEENCQDIMNQDAARDLKRIDKKTLDKTERTKIFDTLYGYEQQVIENAFANGRISEFQYLLLEKMDRQNYLLDKMIEANKQEEKAK